VRRYRLRTTVNRSAARRRPKTPPGHLTHETLVKKAIG
jgi:hypothetical protein